MGLSADRGLAHDAGCAAIGPCECEGDDDEQGCELVGIGDVGILNVEAAGLGVCVRAAGLALEAFDAPAPTVEIERVPLNAADVGGDDECLAAADAFGFDAQAVGGGRFHAVQPTFP